MIDTAAERVIYKIVVGRGPTALIKHPTKPLLISPLHHRHNTSSVIQNVMIGKRPASVSLSGDGGDVYIVSSGADQVSVFSMKVFGIVSTIPAGANAGAMAICRDGRQGYVTNHADGTITILKSRGNRVTPARTCGSHCGKWNAVKPVDGAGLMAQDEDLDLFGSDRGDASQLS
jgi:DNA-binding beta-propeller fold protein YncE